MVSRSERDFLSGRLVIHEGQRCTRRRNVNHSSYQFDIVGLGDRSLIEGEGEQLGQVVSWTNDHGEVPVLEGPPFVDCEAELEETDG